MGGCEWLSVGAAVAVQAYTAHGLHVVESTGEAHLYRLARHGVVGIRVVGKIAVRTWMISHTFLGFRVLEEMTVPTWMILPGMGEMTVPATSAAAPRRSHLRGTAFLNS